MAVSQALLDMVRDALAPLGAVTVRRMFGGASLYCDGVLFALVDDDALYFKADDTTKARYEADGLGPFTYEGKTRPVSMSYWRTPERLYDDPDEMLDYAREAIGVAVKANSAKAKRPASRPKRADAAAKLGAAKNPSRQRK